MTAPHRTMADYFAGIPRYTVGEYGGAIPPNAAERQRGPELLDLHARAQSIADDVYRAEGCGWYLTVDRVKKMLTAAALVALIESEGKR